MLDQHDKTGSSDTPVHPLYMYVERFWRCRIIAGNSGIQGERFGRSLTPAYSICTVYCIYIYMYIYDIYTEARGACASK